MRIHLIFTLITIVLFSNVYAEYNSIENLPDKKRYAFFPGSFDPPHRSHFQTVYELIVEHNFDKVYIPINTRGPKNYTASIEERLKLVQEMYRVFGNKVEIMLEPQEGKEFLKAQLASKINHRLFGVTGGDGWDLLPDDAKKDTTRHWLVMPRPELNAENNYPLRDNLYVLKRKDYGNGISSSELREILKNKEHTPDIPESTLRLLQDLDLYYHHPDKESVFQTRLLADWEFISQFFTTHHLEIPTLKSGQSPKAWRENILRIISDDSKHLPHEASKFFASLTSFVKLGSSANHCKIILTILLY